MTQTVSKCKVSEKKHKQKQKHTFDDNPPPSDWIKLIWCICQSLICEIIEFCDDVNFKLMYEMISNINSSILKLDKTIQSVPL